MGRDYRTDVDREKQERYNNITSVERYRYSALPPWNPAKGQIWIDSRTDHVRVFTGTGWSTVDVLNENGTFNISIKEKVEMVTAQLQPEIGRDTAKNVIDKIHAFEEVLASPEPPQRLGFEEVSELKIDLDQLPGGWTQDEVMYYATNLGIYFIDRNKTP